MIRSPFGLFAAPAESPFGPLCPFFGGLWATAGVKNMDNFGHVAPASFHNIEIHAVHRHIEKKHINHFGDKIQAVALGVPPIGF